MENKNSDEEMSELYYKLYTSCLKYRDEKKLEINCEQYYKQIETFSLDKSVDGIYRDNKYIPNPK